MKKRTLLSLFVLNIVVSACQSEPSNEQENELNSSFETTKNLLKSLEQLDESRNEIEHDIADLDSILSIEKSQ